jgi:rhodanese-related sulfurtransferase
VVICHHGVRSLNVANGWLRTQGFEAQSLRGGIDAWSRDVDPAVARY